jgi:non-specific serine/threonine protein kinase/serine/threonine-protein kinase
LKQPDGVPERIGPYRIESILGEGGMGVVYAAEQTEPVRRRVALKLIRGGTAGDDIAARFDAERQALAVMEHPGIAKVLDAGTTSGGSPYFVMEYVDGVPLTDFCDEAGLGIDERLQLFVDVCDAIQHAHQKGVIHRDLKPSNILVTEQAGSPLPKIIDFGIAKAVGTKLTEKTLATSMGQVLGTPAYMSPEQAEGTGLDVDTRADVYALGVILYELLVGVLPIDPDELGFLPFLTQLITEDVPTPRPSSRLAGDQDCVTTTATRRRTTPEQLHRRLTGDLDWIAMKAIETDRERRYGSSRELASDVGRYLRNEPVTARPPSVSYRARKFVRRNRAAVLGAAAAFVLIVAGTIASSIGLVRANRAEAAATAQGEIARLEAATANEASSFLVDLFSYANPGRAGQPDVPAETLLDQGVLSIEEELAGQPLLQAELLSTMSWTYKQIGKWDRARELMRRQLELREGVLPADAPDLASAVAELLDLLESTQDTPDEVFYNDPEIMALAQRALDIRQRHIAADTVAWADAVSEIAFINGEAGEVETAVAIYRESLDRAERELGRDHSAYRRFLFGLQTVHLNSGQYAEAGEVLELSLDLERAAAEPDSSTILAILERLHIVEERIGDPDVALVMHEEVFALEKEIYADEPPDRMTNSYWNLAAAYEERERWDDAIAIWKEYIAGFETVYGPDHPNALTGHILLGDTYREAGEHDLAVESAKHGMTGLVRVSEDPDMHNPIDRELRFLADILLDAGRPEPETEVLAVAGGTSQIRQDALQTLGQVLEERGDVASASRVRGKTLALVREATDHSPDERPNRLRDAYYDVAFEYITTGAGDRFLELMPRWLADIEEAAPGENPATLRAQQDMAGIMFAGMPWRGVPPLEALRPRAHAHARRALEMRERMDGDGIHLIVHLAPLRASLLATGRDAEARQVQDRVRRLINGRIAEFEEMQASGEIVEAARWSGNCWWAALSGLPELAMRACDPAVEGARGIEVPRHHDSRGVARALLGDYEGAIADFEVFISNNWSEDPYAIQRQRWVDRMRAGEAPFSQEELGALAF